MSSRTRPTIGDVALLAGVSRSAVSRTFTEGASASPKTATRVREAAIAIGYRPNLVARSLSTRRSHIVAIAISRLDNSFHADLLQGLGYGLNAIGYRTMLFLLDRRGDEDPPIDEVLRHQVDAIILCTARLSSSFAAECRRAGVPVLLLNRLAEASGVAAVTGDNMAGGQRVAAFLAAGGHRRPAFIAGSEDASTSREREAGFAAGLHAAGLPAALRGLGLFDPASAAVATRALLARPDPPDAIFCANDHMAFAAIDVARREFGAEIGRTLSVVGFDGSRPATWSGIDLTSFEQPPAAMADAGVAMLGRLLANDPPAAPHVVIPGELAVRASARLPAQGLVERDGRTVWRPTPTPGEHR